MSRSESRVSKAFDYDGEPDEPRGPARRPLERASTINSLTPTSVSIWNLVEPSEGEKQTITRKKVNNNRERVIGNDDRRKVQIEEFGPQGRYRFICKLVGQYKQSVTDTEIVEMHGTGWLIAKDLVVTAGHVLFDSDIWGGLTSIKVYIGYAGNHRTNVELQYGKFVAVPTEWIKDANPNPKYDVGFIKLCHKFNNVNPIKYMATPETGCKELGIVGYPFDLEKGQYMYEHFLKVNWKLAEAKRNMLQYSIDTFGGQSGSPVLLNHCGKYGIKSRLHRCQLFSIGVHAYGGDPNVASVIGSAGNVFEDFLLAVDVRNGDTESSRVISFKSLSDPLPGFETLSVHPTAAATSKQPTGNMVTWKTSSIDISDEHDLLTRQIRRLLRELPIDRRMQVLNEFRGYSGESADDRSNKQSNERPSNLQIENDSAEDLKVVHHESTNSGLPLTYQSGSGET